MDRVGKGRPRHRLRAGADGLDHQAPLKLAQKPPVHGELNGKIFVPLTPPCEVAYENMNAKYMTRTGSAQRRRGFAILFFHHSSFSSSSSSSLLNFLRMTMGMRTRRTLRHA